MTYHDISLEGNATLSRCQHVQTSAYAIFNTELHRMKPFLFPQGKINKKRTEIFCEKTAIVRFNAPLWRITRWFNRLSGRKFSTGGTVIRVTTIMVTFYHKKPYVSPITIIFFQTTNFLTIITVNVKNECRLKQQKKCCKFSFVLFKFLRVSSIFLSVFG